MLGVVFMRLESDQSVSQEFAQGLDSDGRDKAVLHGLVDRW